MTFIDIYQSIVRLAKATVSHEKRFHIKKNILSCNSMHEWCNINNGHVYSCYILLQHACKLLWLEIKYYNFSWETVDFNKFYFNLLNFLWMTSLKMYFWSIMDMSYYCTCTTLLITLIALICKLGPSCKQTSDL